jgi:hypothetical protein
MYFKKSISKIISSGILALCTLAVSAQHTDRYAPTAEPDRIVLNVTADPSTSMAVNWRTSDAVPESFAEIAVAEADPRFVSKARKLKASTQKLVWEDTPAANYHSVIFEGLQPGTKYAYRVGGEQGWSEWIHFTTAGTRDQKLSFIYYGDVQVNISSLWSRVAREAYAKTPDARLAIYAGDLINKANRDVEWGDWFRGGGFIHSMIPAFPTPGNHDHFDTPEGINTTSVFWRPQFTLPENGPKGLEETCYYADVQGVRFVSLNSDQVDVSEKWTQVQKEWLEGILKNNPNKWTVITFHHPIFSPKTTRDNKRMRETFKPLFDQYKVDLVLQGHDHTYARGMVNIPMKEQGAQSGTMYVVSVSGPKMTDSNVDRAAWMDRSAIYTQLFHVVNVEGEKLSFDTYTATGELYDAFDLVKQKGKINSIVERVPASIAEEFPAEIVKFKAYEGNPLFKGTGDPKTWDEKIRERGYILREGSKYYMWYTGYTKATGDSMKYLGLATSYDGIKWTRYAKNPIHSTLWVEDMCVLKEGKTYYMFAESKDDIAHLLTSTDRIHWKDQGAIDIRLKNGSPLSKGPYGTPAVWKEKGIWYLFYERNDAAVWLATSKDLKTWTNVQDEPVLNAGPEKYDAFAVAFNKIIQHKGLYYAYYHASAFKDWREWTMNVAVSKDLIHWKKYEGNPIVGNDSSSGFPVFDGKQWRFYTMHPDVRVYFPEK